jgi:peptide-methionine (S)-S-oxide reductase
MLFYKKQRLPQMPLAEEILPGREFRPFEVGTHEIFARPLLPPYPEGYQKLVLGLGCFWGAERAFWQENGVYVTAVGYAGGTTPNPTYEEVCTGLTGHAEVVLIVFNPGQLDCSRLLKKFFEIHDPTQGMQQGNDIGTQYRSMIMTYSEAHRQTADAARLHVQKILDRDNTQKKVTTEVLDGGEFYFAEPEHQQYLARNPNGYCGLKGLGFAMGDF